LKIRLARDRGDWKMVDQEIYLLGQDAADYAEAARSASIRASDRSTERWSIGFTLSSLTISQVSSRSSRISSPLRCDRRARVFGTGLVRHVRSEMGV
jgi:hypothetical protein